MSDTLLAVCGGAFAIFALIWVTLGKEEPASSIPQQKEKPCPTPKPEPKAEPEQLSQLPPIEPTADHDWVI